MSRSDFAPVGETTRASVIWISGHSASGKTTVGRRVESALRAEGLRTVFLDGDDLRSIFGRRWGYERKERVELARVYFRLCSHLASQGCTVVISAVAMYEDARTWLKDNVPGAVEVYLDVPEAERRIRDRATRKGIYGRPDSPEPGYEPPATPDLVIPNHGPVTVDEAAERIVRHVLAQPSVDGVDHGRSEHWRGFYSEARAPSGPSSFAMLVAERIPPAARVVDVGCGNGRDAFFLAERGHAVTGIDVSAAAISLCESQRGAGGPSFRVSDLPSLSSDAWDVVYTRFALHAMTEPEEDAFIAAAASSLASEGRLFVEARSINDPLARRGEVISKTERMHGHYRRFIIVDELLPKLRSAGFTISKWSEEAGVAKFGDDDPVVVRIEASVDHG